LAASEYKNRAKKPAVSPWSFNNGVVVILSSAVVLFTHIPLLPEFRKISGFSAQRVLEII
jgi:hypothetical protein